MKAPSIFLISCLFASVYVLPAMAAGTVGIRTVDIPAPARGTELHVMIWYPAAPGGTRVLVGEDRLFRGTAAWQDAPPADGRFPLVLMSHGSGGSIANLDWLATHLAAAGFIVAGPNHPQTTRGNSTPIDTMKMWQRPADLSAVLTALTADPAWRDHVDADRVGALGFSLGGHTVMALAGMRANLEAYATYCDTYPAMADCVWFTSGHVDMRQTDRALFEQSNLDARFKSVVAVDPSVVLAFTAESLRSISIPVHLINLGNSDQIPVAVMSKDIAAEINGADYQTVDGAVHLSFLAECLPSGRDLLKASGDKDPVCDDAPGAPRTRAAIHAEIAAIVEAAFLRDFRH